MEGFSTALDFSLTAEPLPEPPPPSSDPVAARTIAKRGHLFKIVSPIHVPRLACLLKKHPNKPFVNSILRGLTKGFWPMSAIPSDDTVIHENHASGKEAEEIMEKAKEKELKFDRYLEPFNTLSQGMKVAPICLATNKSGKMRMCTDMSYGNPSPNNLIDKSLVSIQLDSIASFIPYMLKRRNRNEKFVVWKSDWDSAFRTLPVCFQQQVQQIVKIKNQFYVDRCVNFGSAASHRIWCSYFSLILWIACFEMGVDEFNSYMDDRWGLILESDIVKFKDRRIPLNQAKFLELFDHLCIPWNWEKQIWGSQIEVIGHWIDCNAMSISLSDKKRLALGKALSDFSIHRSQPLVQWARLTGWANWGLNIFPLGRWALQSSWEKMAGKTKQNALVPSNTSTRADLKWLSEAFLNWEGRQIFNAFFWKLSLAEAIYFCDACPTGLGIWVPSTHKGFHYMLPPPSRDTYWGELTLVVAAILLGESRGAKSIAIFTDSENVVNLFNSHKAIDSVRGMFRTAVTTILESKTDVKAKHVPGERNMIADHLSRNNLNLAKQKIPALICKPISVLPPLMNGGIKRPLPNPCLI